VVSLSGPITRVGGLTPRFLIDLRPWIRRNRPLDDTNRARHLVRYFIDAVESEVPVEPPVLQYITQALRRARESGTIGKELGIVRLRAGNPGTRTANRRKSLRKGRLSAAEKAEIAQRIGDFKSAQKKGTLDRVGNIKKQFLSKFLDDLALEYRVSKRTIERQYVGQARSIM
jgi:hypothetical protein